MRQRASGHHGLLVMIGIVIGFTLKYVGTAATTNACFTVDVPMNVSENHCWQIHNITGCRGYCLTMQSGTSIRHRLMSIQKVCSYDKFTNVTYRLNNCQPGYTPHTSILPKALSCRCGQCNTTYSHCTP